MSCHGARAAARASALEVLVKRGSDRKPGPGETVARLVRRQAELEDGPAEWRPFDVDEGDETSVDRIKLGERRVHDAVRLGGDEIVVRPEHKRLAPCHWRVNPCPGVRGP